MLCGNFRGIRSQHLLDSIWKLAARPVVILSLVSLITVYSVFVLVPSFYSADTSYRSCRRLHSRLAHHFSFMANATSRPSHRLFVCFACFIIFLSYNRSQMNTSVYYHINGRSMFNAECSMRITYPSILPFIFHILLL